MNFTGSAWHALDAELKGVRSDALWFVIGCLWVLVLMLWIALGSVTVIAITGFGTVYCFLRSAMEYRHRHLYKKGRRL